jgi:hypothetical protein
LVLLDDPGDWNQRVARYRPVHAELERQQQRIAGFPMFWRDGDVARLGVPFRRRDGGPAFAPPADWQLREQPAGKTLVVYPDTGDLAARAATGAQLLAAASRERKLTPDGPIVHQPFLHLHEGEPAAEHLQAPVVRVTVALR